MDQKPMQGSASLEPPTPAIAQLYLEEAIAIGDRRERWIDRRAAAWQAIITTVVLAVLLTAQLLVMRAGDTGFQSLLFLILVVGQINAGLAERSGMQWRIPGSQRWFAGVVVLFAVAVIGSYFALLVSPTDQPLWLYFAPGAVLSLGGGGLGIMQLRQARGSTPQVAQRHEALPRSTRIATACLGIVMGLAAFSTGLDDDLAVAIVWMVVMMTFVAWMFAGRSDFGPMAFGRYWRRPQFTAFAIGLGVMTWLSLQAAYSTGVTPAVTAGCGGAVMVLMIGAAWIPARHLGRGFGDGGRSR